MTTQPLTITIIGFTICLMDMMLLDYYSQKLATAKSVNKYSKVGIILLFSFILYIFTSSYYTNAGTILSLLLMCLYTFLLFSGSVAGRISTVIFYYVISGMASLLVTSVVAMFTPLNYDDLLKNLVIWVILSIVIKLCVLCCGTLLGLKFGTPSTRQDTLKGLIQYLVIIFVVLLLLYEYLYYSNVIKTFNITAMMSLIFTASFILIIVLINRYYSIRNAHHLTEMKLHEALLKNQGYIQSVQQQLNTAKLKHDFKNHLITLQSMVEAQDFEDALDYIQTLYTHPGMKSYVNTKNLTFNAILNAKISEHPHIKFKVRHDDAFFKLPHTLLTIVLGNAIDNAIEATETCTDNQEIQIYFSENQQYVKLVIMNPYCDQPLFDDDRPIAHNNDIHRGLGVGNILEAVQSLNGSVTFNAENGIFTFKMLIMLENVHQ